MSDDFFSRLETELGSLLNAGSHLEPAGRSRRRAITLIRRSVATLALAAALAASLDGEFPASATGHPAFAPAPVAVAAAPVARAAPAVGRAA